ncbi:MAG: hypothetical protein RLZZ324_454 [Candidatus Parcubacteria bacterium]|jgi:GMP synthase (glutamine-hydrolysing)
MKRAGRSFFPTHMPKSRIELRVTLYHFQENERTLAVLFDSVVRSTGLAPSQIIAVPVPDTGPSLADIAAADAVIVSGAKWSVWEDVPNQPALVEVLKEARARRMPMLGICFGEQLLAHVFGGTVVADKPHGEWGTFDMTLTDAAESDALFSGMPRTFPAQCAHNDQVTALPPGATLLAGSALCPVQAFAIQDQGIYGVQFHPERSRADYVSILDIRGQKYFGSEAVEDYAGSPAAEKAREVREGLRETPDAESVMSRFIDRIVLRKNA